MHLIAPLAAGIRGADNGTAELYERGTATPATWYATFETDSGNSSGDPIDLDAYGSAEVYVNQVVDVVVKDEDGVTVREFTAGYSAPAIEVRSSSFTGSAYVGGASAPGNPTTLQAVLDAWLTSAGSIDFKVLVGGVATNLDDAITSGFGSTIFNVKASTYGATGDGSTDDRSAIAAAITAAAVSGGIVFFPPGTYRFTSSLTVPYNVSLLGCGSNQSILEPSHASNNHLVFTGSASARRFTLVMGLGILPDVASTGAAIYSSTAAILDLKIVDCSIGTTTGNLDGPAIDISTASAATLDVRGSRMHLTANTTVVTCGTNPLVMRDCYLRCTDSAGRGLFVNAQTLDISGCTFDNTSTFGPGTTLGTTNGNIQPSNDANAISWRISNCTFTAPGSNNIVAIAPGLNNDMNASSVLHEHGNVFGASVFPYRVRWGTTSKGAKCWLGSRVGRRTIVASNSSPLDLSDEAMDYETVVVTRSSNASQTVEMPGSTTYTVLPDGNYTTIIVWNTSGGNIVAETFSFRGAGAAVGITDTEAALVHLKNIAIDDVTGPYALAPVVDLDVPYT